MQAVHKIERMPNQNDVLQQAVKSLFSAAYTLRKQQEQILSLFGLTIPKLEVLQIVNSKFPSGVSQKELREKITDKTVDLPRLIQSLQKAEILRQDRNVLNRRVSDIVITEKGIEVLDKVATALSERGAIASSISNEEAIQLIELLQKLATSTPLSSQ